MRVLRLCSTTIMIATAAGLTCDGHAAEIVMLRAGTVAGANVVISLDKHRKPRRIVVRTKQVGVAGSRLDVSVDASRSAAFSHFFVPAECKFDSDGSMCDFVLPQTNPIYAKTLSLFSLARVAHVTVIDAGVMRMDQTLSLKGFTRALRG